MTDPIRNPSSNPEGAGRRRRPLWLRILVSFVIAMGLAVVVIEVVSRVADGVLASKTSKPDFDYKTYEPGMLDGLALGTLEFGSVKRAAEQAHPRNVPHPYLGYSLTPSYRTPPGSAQQASHNSLGFRGKETTWEKPPGVFRIVTTGGSSVYGQSESSDAAVWSQRLEDLFGEVGGRKVEVINVGCNGWSSFEMLINLELRALDFSPDLVIVYEAINDMRCALYTRGGPVTGDNLQWRATWPVDRPSPLEEWLDHSRTYLVWRRYMTDYIAKRSDLGFFAITNYDPSPTAGDFYVWYGRNLAVPEKGFENYRRNLNNMVSVCTSRGARVLFAMQALPLWHLDAHQSANEQKDAFERIQNIEREVAHERGVALFECGRVIEAAAEQEIVDLAAARCREDPKLDPAQVAAVLKSCVPYPPRRPDLVEALRKVFPTPPADLLFRSEVHPSDRGSDLIAHTIFEYLRSSDLIPH
jgi:hypothetical protein